MKEPLSAKEHAEKIFYDMFVLSKEIVPGDVIERVAAEIQEAEREAVVHEFEGEDCTVARLEHEAYANGYKAGAEAMRKEALEWCMAFRRDDGTAQQIEEKLRGLQTPEGGKRE